MKSKEWVVRSLCTVIIITCGLAVFLNLYNYNYYFNHNALNINKFQPDERKYKTNYLNNNENNYDSILLGSSSTTYINENYFEKFKVFNYSVSGMIPLEYQHAIKHLESKNKGDIKNIFIALEFFTSNYNEVTRINKFNIGHYILESEDNLYVLKELLNLASLRNIIADNVRTGDFEKYYIRWGNVHHTKIFNEKLVSEKIKAGIKKHTKEFAAYTYHMRYKDELLSLKKNNSNKNFYIIITPVAKPYMDLILKNKFQSYIAWLEETVEVFESIYIYPYSNSITNNYLTNFKDNRHYYPIVGKEIVDSIFNENDNELILLTKNNIGSYLSDLVIKRKALMNDN